MPQISPTLLGNRYPYNLPEPQQLDNNSWLQVSASSNFTSAIKSDNILYAWGVNNTYQIGDGTTINKSLPVQISSSSFSLVSAGFDHSVALTTDNQLLTWGNRPSIQSLTTNDSWLSIVNGGNHFLAIRNDGMLFAWGFNDRGQIGDNSTLNKSSPVQIGSSSYSMISASYYNSAALTTTGQLFVWGLGSAGQMSQNNTVSYSSPVQVTTAGVSSWIFVSSGNQYYLAIDSTNRLFGWGYNNVYQLGLNDQFNTGWRSNPVQIGTNSWTMVSAGGLGDHSTGIDIDGNIYVWGNFASIFAPIPTTIYSWTQLSAGGQHTSAIRSDNTLWVWGLNSSGQLGQQNTTVARSSPVQVTSSSFTQVSSKFSHSAAIKADGTLLLWGLNSSGQLGNNSTLNRSSPIQLASGFNLSSYTQVTAGTSNTATLAPNSTIYLWGDGSAGQLGNLETINRSSPTQLGALFQLRDSSTNNYVLTRTGTDYSLVEAPTLTGSPISGYFDSNGYIYTNLLGNLISFGATGATFTGEFWVKFDDLGVNRGLLGFAVGGTSGAVLYRNANNGFTVISADGGSLASGTTTNSANNLITSTGVWYHVAFVKYPTALFDVFLNGAYAINGGSIRDPFTWMSAQTYNIYIGATFTYSGNSAQPAAPHFLGYISNVRVVSGVRVYTGAFTVPTSVLPLTQSSGTNISAITAGQTALLTYTTAAASLINYSPSSWSFVDAGDRFFVAKKSDGTLYAWGLNTSGQVGVASVTNRSSPSQIAAGSWLQISVGFDHTLAIRSDNSLWTWGNWAAIGLVTEVQSWLTVSGGSQNSLAIKADGTLWGWGANAQGQVGDNTVLAKSSPVNIGSASWSGVAAGNSTSYAINDVGALYAWGWNSSGQIGDNTSINKSSPVVVAGSNSWSLVKPGVDHVEAIDTLGRLYAWGNYTTGQTGIEIYTTDSWIAIANGLALRADNTLWSWGTNPGDGTTIIRSSPIQIGTNDWANIALIYQSTYAKAAIKTNNTLWMWGDNSNGQLGQNDTINRSSPVQVAGSWLQVSTQLSNTAAIDSSNVIYTWGNNSSGQLGDNTTINKSSPVTLASPFNASNWTLVSVGYSHMAALRTDGALYLWGRNNIGQLGNNNPGVNRSNPVLTALTTSSFVAVSAGASHNIAIRSSDRALFGWGAPWGNGTAPSGNNMSAPTQVGTSSWLQVAAGSDSSYGITMGGALFAWGTNTNGLIAQNINWANFNAASVPIQLGSATNWLRIMPGAAITSNYSAYVWGPNNSAFNNTAITYSSLVQVGSKFPSQFYVPEQVGSSSWTTVESGNSFTVALDTNNLLYGWGLNTSGQLGDRTTINKSSSVQLSTESWIAIAAEFDHVLAIRNDTTLWTWGNSAAIGLVTYPQSWSKISAGNSHTLAIRSDGALFTWGLNSSGQLGLGDTISRSSPTLIGFNTSILTNSISASSWSQISAGNNFSTAIDINNKMFVWGLNTSFQLGDNFNVSKSLPTQIGYSIIDQSTYNNVVRVYGQFTNNSITPFNGSVSIQTIPSLTWGMEIPYATNMAVWNDDDFMMECWVHPLAFTVSGTNSLPLVLSHGLAWSTGTYWAFGFNTAGNVQFYYWTGSQNFVTGGGGGTLNSWQHIAMTHTNATGIIRLYLNGVLAIAATKVATPQQFSLYDINIGAVQGTGFNGYISNVRIVKGNIVYTGEFFPSTSPLTVTQSSSVNTNAITAGQTSLLLLTIAASITNNSWTLVSAGDHHSLALRSDGILYSWGRNDNGQAGRFNSAQSWTSVYSGADAIDFIAIKNDNTLWAWGYNSEGQLATRDALARSSPVQVAAGSWTYAAIGRTHGLAIRNDGTLWVWGNNDYGQLGLGNTTIQISPVQVTSVAESWTQVTAGTYHSLGITATGKLYAWGRNLSGQLGDNSVINKSTPIQITSVTGSWSQIRTTGNNGVTAGILSTGTIYTWGLNSSGQLGNNQAINRSNPVLLATPFDTSSWTMVAVSSDYMMAISNNGALYGWGTNDGGQLGNNTVINRSNPTLVIGATSWTNVAVTWNSPAAVVTAAIATNGNLWTWGRNGSGWGTLGDGLGVSVSKSSPVQISSSSFTMLAAGDGSIIARRTDGLLFTWGLNTNGGQLGLNDALNRSSPVLVGNLPDMNRWSPVQVGNSSWNVVSAGTSFSTGIDSNSALYAWGLNSTYQLGDTTTVDKYSPITIATGSWTTVNSGSLHSLAIRSDSTLWGWGSATALSINNVTPQSWSQIANGTNSSHNVAIQSDGTLWAWGLNTSGQLGDGTVIAKSSPVLIDNGSWSKVTSSLSNTYAIKADGTLWGWGDNATGQLAQVSNVINRSSPVLIDSGSWSHIAAGQNFALGIKNNSLFTWGLNSNGLLGLTNTINRSSITQVGTSSWSAIAAGQSFALAINNVGQLYAWGVNSSYQLGDNTTANKSSPTQIGVNNILSWTTVAAGLDHSLALDINGKLWTWGNQNSISVDYHSWTQVATGVSYTLALRNDGVLFAWGLNTSGQLGLGDVINRSSPVIVSSRSNYTQISAGNALSAAIDVNSNLFVWGRNGEGQDGLGLALGTNSVPVKVKVFPITINDGSSYNRATTINNGGDASRGPIPYNSVWVDSNSQPVPWPGATSAYSPGRNNLSIANTTELTLNSSQWTVEFWIYVRQWPGISTGNQDFHILGNTGSGDYWAFSAQNASPTPFYRWYTGTWSNVGVTTFGWDHLAAVRDNTTITVYLNGVATFTGGVVGTATNALIVFGNPGSAFTGGWGDFYISNIRIVKGISVYTSTFTPPRINLTSTQSANINGSPSAAISGTETSYLIFNNPASVTYTAASWTQVSVFDGPMAITTEGKLYAWSVNTFGQTGDGTTINKSTPVLIGNSSWTSVSAGLSFTLATDVNKNLFTWGLNNGFQLGNGTTINRSSPVQVGQINPNSWNIISAGFSHAAAIDTTYKLYVWGPANQVTLITPTFSWIYLSASSSGHIMGLRNDYTLWGWGLNNAGQLGDNTTINKSSPVIVGGTSLWNNVRVGGSHTVAIKSDGTLWAWGLNTSGQIGDGLGPNRSSPVLVSSSSFTVISAGFNHTGAITGDNKLFMAGGNASGQIGDGTTTNRNPLVQITGSWSLVSASTSFTSALNSTNLLFTWGLNSSGQLGIGLTTNRSSPVAVGALSWSSVDSEGNHVVALSTTNSLFVWGGNNIGQLGLGNTINRSSPVSVDSNSWSWVSAGDSFTVAIRDTGQLYTWGLNSSGQLGSATTINRSSPVQVGTSSWTNVTAGVGFTSGRRVDGLGFVWGLGTSGQIGDLSAISKSSPVQLNATPNVVSNYTVPTKINDSSYTQVTAGESTTTALRSDGKLYAWGLNTSGQIGDNTAITKSSPVQIGTSSWTAIASGFLNAAISSLNGVLFNWGIGGVGQLGSNTTINRSSPTQLNAGLATYAIPSNILGNQSFTAIAAGSSYSVGLRVDNALMGWGVNNSGQLGDSTLIFSTRSNPTLVGQPAYKDNSNYNLLVSSITGAPKPVDFSPFASRPYNVATYGGSMRFNGANDIIQFGSNTMFDIGSNDASVEVWAYWNSFATSVVYMTLFGQNSGATSTIRIQTNLTNEVAIVYYTYNDDNARGATSVSTNTWYHLLVTVDAGTIRFFINGNLINYAPNATPVLTKNEAYVFGNEDTGYFNGFMSNFRFINGSVPTSYQTAAKAGILDVSTYDARVNNNQSYVTFGTSVIPFASATAGYFPGNVNGTPSVNSYLTLPNASQYQFGTGDFTVEFYMRKDSSYNAGTLITMNTAALGNWAVIMSAGTMFWQNSYTLNSLSPGISIATYLPIDTWVHVAIVRISGNTNIYINGTSRSNFADTTNYNGTGIITIGSAPTATYGTFEGYLSNIRVVKGVGVYTGNFTSPTTPLQATQSSDTNISAIVGTETSLLLFNDTSSAVSSVSVFSVPTAPLTTTSQGATASDVALLCFQGSTTPYTNVNAQGTTSGFNNSSGQLYTVGLGTNGILGDGTATTRSKPVQLGTEFTGPNTRIISPNQLLSGSWVSVNAGVSTSTAIRNDNTLWAWGLNTSGQLGTSNATNQTLPKQTFNIVDSSTYNQTIYHIGTNYSEAVIPFAGAISGTFNGIDEYVYLTSPSQLIFGTSDFTIEFWVYAENYIFNGGNVTLIDWRSVNGAFPAIIAGPGGLWYYVNTATRIAGPVLLTNMWHHVAVCRQSSNTRMFLDGVQVGSTYADTTTYNIGTNRFIVGTDGVTSPGAVNNLKGYISNIRVVSGVAVYTGNFTVPSSPLSATQSSGVNISAITAGQTVFLSYTTPASIANKNYIETSTENSTYNIEDTYNLYSTGLNNVGQLGITDSITKSIPIQVGAIGQTINTYTNSPVQVTPGTSGYSQIWVGQSFSAARRTNNDIFTWGLGTSGQLGLLDLISRSSPTLMSSTQSWNQVVSVGHSHWVTVRNVDFNFLDSSTNNFSITRQGPNTEYSTTIIPFATAVSVLQRVNDPGQLISAQTALSFGTDDFTIECWIFPTNLIATFAGVVDARAAATASSWFFGLRNSATYKVELYLAGIAQNTAATTIQLNVWTHIAATRNSGTVNIWVNGVSDLTGAGQTAAVNAAGTNQFVGRLIDTPAYAFPGYISNLRIVKGVAVYTGAFTVPTSPLDATQSSGSNISAITGTQTSLLTFRTEASSVIWQANNKMYVQGGNGSGQLGTLGGSNRTSFVLVGNGTHINSGTLSPVQVGFDIPNSWTSVSAGTSYSYARNTLGQTYVWGINTLGVLSTTDTINRSSPTLLGATSTLIDQSQYTNSITNNAVVYTTAITPFVGAVSAFFNGSATLFVPGQTWIQNGGNAFTVEFWYYPTALTGTILRYGLIGSLYAYELLWTGGGLVYRGNNSGSGSYTGWGIAGSGSMTTNQWYYISIVSDNSNNKYFNINGAFSYVGAGGINSYAVSFPNGLTIGSGIQGYISNIRITQTNIYTAAFTPPTSPLQNSGTATGSSNAFTSADVGLLLLTSPNNITGQVDFNLISAGGTHVVTTNSTNWMYNLGNNVNGQLGDNTTINRLSPVLVGNYLNTNTISPILAASASWSNVNSGTSYNLAIRTDGLLFAWGLNNAGQLGVNDLINRSSIVQIGTSSFSLIAAGHSTSVATDVYGMLFAWGLGTSGQLGNNTAISRSSPVQIGTNSWTSVTTGNIISGGIDEVGALYVWGNGTVGQFGTSTVIARSSPTLVQGINYETKSPTLVSGLWDSVSAGNSHTAGIQGGSLYAWGLNNAGQLGVLDTINRSSPTAVGATLSITDASANNYTPVTIWNEPAISLFTPIVGTPSIAFGGNDGFGYTSTTNLQFGTGAFTIECFIYVTVNSAETRGIVSKGWNSGTITGYNFAVRPDETLGFTIVNTLYSHPTVLSLNTWYHVAVTRDSSNDVRLFVNGISSGVLVNSNYDFNDTRVLRVGLTRDGAASLTNWFRGNISNLRIVKGTALYTANFTPPTTALTAVSGTQLLLATTLPSTVYASVFAGTSTSFGIRQDGTLYAWGLGTTGQIGGYQQAINRSAPNQIGNNYINVNQNSPVQIAAGSWTKVSAGNSVSAAIRSDGGLFTWGSLATSGQIGDGTTIAKSSPVQIGNSSWTQISVYDTHMIGVDNIGSAYTWGLNASGQLGITSINSAGDIINRSNPTLVGPSLTIIDASNYALPISRNGSSFSTSNVPLTGAVAGYFNGTTDYVTTGTGTNTNLGTGDFTAEFWFNANSLSGTMFQYGNYQAEQIFTFGFLTGSVRFSITNAGSTVPSNIALTPVSTGVWYHVAMVRISGTYTAYLNGVLQGSLVPAVRTYNTSFGIRMGSGDAPDSTYNPQYYFNGYLSNVRLVKGLGVYTGNFTVPTSILTKSQSAGANINAITASETSLLTYTTQAETVTGGTPTYFTSVATGSSFTGGVSTTGSLYMWGLGTSGQLGTGTAANRSSPIQIGTSSWTSVFAGQTIAAATRNDGALFNWGVNNVYQLGNMWDSINRSSPVQIGNNYAGQGTIYTRIPFKVNNLSWKQVSAGNSITSAISAQDRLFTWGLNTVGQIDQNNTINRSDPTQVGQNLYLQTTAGASNMGAIGKAT